MLHQQDIVTLRDYVTEQLHKGATEAQLRGALMREGGWSVEDLDTIFKLVPHSATEESVPKESPQTTREVVSPTPPAPLTPAGAFTVTHPPAPAPEAPVVPTPMVINAGFMRANNANPDSIPQNVTVSPHKKSHVIPVIVGLFVFAVLGVAGAWAYVALLQKMPEVAPYTEENLLSGLYTKSQEIQTLTSTFSASLAVEPRDADAKPFILPESTQTEEWRAAYLRDVERVSEVTSVRRAIHRYMDSKRDTTFNLKYPQSLDEVMGNLNQDSFEYEMDINTLDPLSQKEYTYTTTKEGSDYALTVIFETDEAVSAVTQGQHIVVAGSLKPFEAGVDGKTVTFTEDINQYLSISSEPPKPLIAQLHEQSEFLPAEFSGSLSIKATLDRNTHDPDGEFSLDASADFGDMSYKLGGDVRKVGADVYAKIRHMPGLLMMFLGQIPKDVWVHITNEDQDTGPWSGINLRLMDSDLEYAEHAREVSIVTETIMQIADEEGLLKFRSTPRVERVDGTSLYRYDLTVHKPALVPFLKRAYAEVQNNDALISDETFDDTALITYLEGDEFGKIFTYLEQNISLTLYVDKNGYPIKTEYGMRLVPPDTATQLAGKQVRITLRSENANINKPISITAPENAVPMKKIMEDMEKNMEYGRTSSVPDPLNMVANVLGSLGNILNAPRE